MAVLCSKAGAQTEYRATSETNLSVITMNRNNKDLNYSVSAADPIYYNYSAAALEDELTYLLSSKSQCEVILDEEGHLHINVFHPYQNQAEGLLHKINVYDPLPEFVIWEQDIPLGLAKALENLGNVTMEQVITNTVCRLYESVNPNYFHINGILRKVKWRVAK
jgi:hypothetical protein